MLRDCYIYIALETTHATYSAQSNDWWR